MLEERSKPATMILTDPGGGKKEQKERMKEKNGWKKELSLQVALRPAEAQTSAKM